MRVGEHAAIAIDCRELTKPALSALAQVLLSILRHNPSHEYVLLSDLPLKPEFVPPGSSNLYHGRRNRGGVDVIRYHYWMKRVLQRMRTPFFYEIDHYALFRVKHTKTITTIHDLYVLEKLEKYALHHRLAYRLFIRATIRNSDAITVDSSFTAARLRHFFGNRVRASVLPMGIDDPSGVPVQPQRLSQKYILSLGRLSTWKGSVRLAELYARHLAGNGFSLVFAGRCDPREASVKSRIEDLARECEEIVWLDYVSDAEREYLLGHAELLCYPSRYDGFGMPPLEAALRMTPCLMNDIPVLREVTKGRGYYVDFYGNDDEVVRAMREMLTAPRDHARLDDLHDIAMEYAWDGYIDRLLSLVEGH